MKALLGFIFLAIVVVASVLLIVNTGIWKKYNEVLPSFNQTAVSSASVAIVGINFADSLALPLDKEGLFKGLRSGAIPLYYYTGSAWIPLKGNTIRVGSREIDVATLRILLADFYFTTPRFPTNPRFRVDDQYSLSLPSGFSGLGGTNLFYDHNGRIPFDVVSGSSRQRIFLTLDNKLYANDWYGSEPIGSQRYDATLLELVRWRDQFLSSGPCVKFISIPFRQADLPPVTYVVSSGQVRSFAGIYVDLNAPTGDRQETYREGCFTGRALLSSELS